MSSPAKKFATYEDLLALPDNVIGELISGELIASPRPKIRHARASSVLGGRITGPFDEGRDGPGGWWILDEPELHFAQDVLVPDLAGWRRKKVPVLPNEAYLGIAPDWICEVLSDSTARLDRVKKLPIYARESVEFVWFIDPKAKTLEVYQLEGARWLLLKAFSGDDRVRVEPFEAIEISLSTLWLPDAP
jgi:Uma2 family endonuclease